MNFDDMSFLQVMVVFTAGSILATSGCCLFVYGWLWLWNDYSDLNIWIGLAVLAAVALVGVLYNEISPKVRNFIGKIYSCMYETAAKFGPHFSAIFHAQVRWNAAEATVPATLPNCEDVLLYDVETRAEPGAERLEKSHY